MMSTPVTHLIAGPDHHGVTAYALRLAEQTGGAVLRVGRDGPVTDAELADLTTPPGPVHATFTDHLWGTDPDDAAARVLGLRTDRLGHPRQVSVSLHDIPQPQEGEDRFARRARAYRRLVDGVDLAVTNSRHEAAFFDGVGGALVEVIHLPLPAPPGDVGDVGGAGPTPLVGMLGFIYPGKGHDEIIRSLAGTGLPLQALGGFSAGHENMAQQLGGLAADHGVEFSATGYLPEEDLHQRMRRVGVPVCAHRHYSASGSLMEWLALGRRVLVSDSPYTREMAQLWPEHVVIVAEGEWTAAIRRAAATPGFADPLPLDRAWGWKDVATRWRQLWREMWPGVSVIIPYYENPQGLAAIITALGEQDYPGPVELVIADDGSPTPPSVPDDAPLPMTVVRQEDLGFRAAAARNLGAAHATHPVLAFLDGDTVPQPGYLRAVAHRVAADPRAVVVGTRLHHTGQGEPAEPEWLRQAWEQTSHLAKADELSWRFIISAVLTCGAGFFRRINGFDTSLVGYGGEDWDLGFRAWRAGARLVHEPDAVALHDGPDWAGRIADPAAGVRQKNAESLALASRITHPAARPPGVRFPTADIAVEVADELATPDDAPGLLEALICAWVDAGDVTVDLTGMHVLPEGFGTGLFAAEPRVRLPGQVAQNPVGTPRLHVTLNRAVCPPGRLELSAVVEEVCARGGRVVLLDDSGRRPLAHVLTRRRISLEQAGALGSEPVEITVDWPVLEGPQRLERHFAGW